jgi:ribonuclease HI
MRPVPFVRSLCHTQEKRYRHPPGSSRIYPGLSVHDTIAGMERNDADYSIIFDGGARGNPGEGYGSYELRTRTGRHIERLTFGNHVTNNEAEYRTLIAALRDVLDRLDAAGTDPKAATIAVRGDSQLVIFQVLGKWKVRTPHIRPLHAEASALIARFKRADIQWQPRAMSVRTLGH